MTRTGSRAPFVLVRLRPGTAPFRTCLRHLVHQPLQRTPLLAGCLTSLGRINWHRRLVMSSRSQNPFSPRFIAWRRTAGVPVWDRQRSATNRPPKRREIFSTSGPRLPKVFRQALSRDAHKDITRHIDLARRCPPGKASVTRRTTGRHMGHRNNRRPRTAAKSPSARPMRAPVHRPGQIRAGPVHFFHLGAKGYTKDIRPVEPGQRSRHGG